MVDILGWVDLGPLQNWSADEVDELINQHPPEGSEQGGVIVYLSILTLMLNPKILDPHWSSTYFVAKLLLNLVEVDALDQSCIFRDEDWSLVTPDLWMEAVRERVIARGMQLEDVPKTEPPIIIHLR